MLDREACLQIAAAPIPGSEPAGSDVSLSSESFMAVQSQIAKVRSPAASQVEWAA
jgi:hypothetical protein